MNNPYGDPFARFHPKKPHTAKEAVAARYSPPEPVKLGKVWAIGIFLFFLIAIVPKGLQLLVRLSTPRTPPAARAAAPAEVPPDFVSIPVPTLPLQELPETVADVPAALAEQIDRLRETEPTVVPSIRTPEMERLLKLLDQHPIPGTIDPKLNAMTLLRESDTRRGSFVRLRGRVIDTFRAEPPAFLAGEPGASVEEVYLEESPGGRTVCFYFINRNRQIVWKTSDRAIAGGTVYPILDWVELEGIYVRPYQYESKRVAEPGRNAVNVAAVVIAKSVRKVRTPPAKVETTGGFAAMAAGAGVVIFLVGFIVVMGRRYGGKLPIRLAVAQARRQQEDSRLKTQDSTPKPQDPSEPPTALS